MVRLESLARAAYAFTGLAAMAARAGLVLVFLAALPALALGQSLGDAARKERERRAKLRESGASAQTVTEEDLATNKGKLANDPKAKPATTGADEKATPPDQGPAAKPRPVPPDTNLSPSPEQYWRARAAAARERVEAAEERVRALERMIRVGQAAEDEATNPQRNIISIYKMKEMADAAAAELTAAQASLEAVLTEARRAGALPGWLR